MQNSGEKVHQEEEEIQIDIQVSCYIPDEFMKIIIKNRNISKYGIMQNRRRYTKYNR